MSVFPRTLLHNAATGRTSPNVSKHLISPIEEAYIIVCVGLEKELNNRAIMCVLVATPMSEGLSSCRLREDAVEPHIIFVVNRSEKREWSEAGRRREGSTYSAEAIGTLMN